jgi:hypothetical protein
MAHNDDGPTNGHRLLSCVDQSRSDETQLVKRTILVPGLSGVLLSSVGCGAALASTPPSAPPSPDPYRLTHPLITALLGDFGSGVFSLSIMRLL